MLLQTFSLTLCANKRELKKKKKKNQASISLCFQQPIKLLYSLMLSHISSMENSRLLRKHRVLSRSANQQKKKSRTHTRRDEAKLHHTRWISCKYTYNTSRESSAGVKTYACAMYAIQMGCKQKKREIHALYLDDFFTCGISRSLESIIPAAADIHRMIYSV